MKNIPQESFGEINLIDSVLDKRKRMEQDLMKGLGEFVVGQEAAKKLLIDTIINGLFNVYRDQGSLGAVMLAGPTGVGKTELARSIARVLLGDPNGFIKISGETMPHPMNIEKLTGSPSGYVGYGDTPWLADIRVHAGYKTAKEKGLLHPLIKSLDAENFSIILVDEIEKAHPDIPNAFLGAIQSGEMEMSSGKESGKYINHSRKTDLRNTLFIFTSNVGEHAIVKSKSHTIGFGNAEESGKGSDAIFKKELDKHFAPEFIGRMDGIVRCHSLGKEHLEEVLALNVSQINKILRRKSYYSLLQVRVTNSYVNKVLEQAKGVEYGARAISGIMKEIGSHTGLALAGGKIPKNAYGVIEFNYTDNVPSLRFLHEKPPANLEHTLSTNDIDTIPVKTNTRDIVEGKINIFGDKIRQIAQEYLNIISKYDSGFDDTCRILEKKLQKNGFTLEDIKALRASTFVEIYQTTDRPDEGEIIVRQNNMFSPVGFRAIEKYLRSAIVKSFSLESIYGTITVLLERPMTRDEAIVISQHIHQLLQGKI